MQVIKGEFLGLFLPFFIIRLILAFSQRFDGIEIEPEKNIFFIESHFKSASAHNVVDYHVLLAFAISQ